jgi:hypothetical protein
MPCECISLEKHLFIDTNLSTLNSVFVLISITIAKNWNLKMKKTIVYVVAACITLSGCATASKDIAALYVSPMQYQGYDCDQLGSETQRIQSRVVQLGGRLDTAASNDKALVGVGLVLFWPALFALGGTKQQEADYARLRGEYDAVQQSAILKKCRGIVVPPSSNV